jgi:hypothetical protein
VFQGEVTQPYEYARTLSNGDKIGVIYVEFMPDFTDPLAMNNEQILNYIEQHHIENADV